MRKTFFIRRTQHACLKKDKYTITASHSYIFHILLLPSWSFSTRILYIVSDLPRIQCAQRSYKTTTVRALRSISLNEINRSIFHDFPQKIVTYSPNTHTHTSTIIIFVGGDVDARQSSVAFRYIIRQTNIKLRFHEGY